MSVIRNGEIPARCATAIARGAINAAAAMFPAPIDAMLSERPKNTIGIHPAFPRQPRSAVRTTWSSVPLPRASVKSSVTPTSVRNRSVGKPAKISAIVKRASPEWSEVDPDHPGQRQGDEPRIDRRRAAQHDHQHQSRQREPGEVDHDEYSGQWSVVSGQWIEDGSSLLTVCDASNSRRSTFPIALRGRASTKTIAAGRW